MAAVESSGRVSRWSEDTANKSSLEAAAEAAAKVNAMLIAKGKLKPSQLSQQQQGGKAKNQSQQGSLIVAEVEINDVPIGCRNMLTRGATQEEISKMSGAAVSTRGRYVSLEEKSKGVVGDRPLYLCVQGPSQESVDIAVGRINEIIFNGMKPKGGSRFSAQMRHPPPQISSGIPRPNLSQPPPLMSVNMQPAGLSFVQEKLYIGLEHAPPSFDVKSKIMGPMGSFLNHIQTETGAKVTLRGKGSGFLEPQSGREAFEPMHVHIQHATLLGLQQSKQLAENLIQTVQQDYAQFQQALVAMPPTLPPGTAAFLAGIQQSATAGLQLNPPGLATIPLSQGGVPTLQPGLQTLSTIGGLPGLSPPQMTQVILPTSSSPAPPNLNTVPGSAPQLLVPSSLTSTSFPVSINPVQTVTSMPAQAGLGPQQQQVYIQTQLHPPGPPPQIPGLPQVAPPHLVPQAISMAPTENSPVPQSLMTTVQPELHLVSQAPVMPAWGTGAPLPQPSPQPHIVSQIPGSSGPPISMVASSPVSVTTSTPSSYTYPAPPKEEPKRRFTEEKQEDKVPENLLGYEHGPPHLTNLVVQGPPPHSQSVPASAAPPSSQYQFPQPLADSVPGMMHSFSLASAPQPSPVYVHTSVSDEGRVTHTYTVQTSTALPHQIPPPPQQLIPQGAPQPYGGSPVHHVIEQRQTESPDLDKKLMPPPAAPVGHKRSGSGERSGVEKKKMKTALSNVSEYGDEDDDVQSSISAQQRDVKKYQYNQYSNAPQLYGQSPETQPIVTPIVQQPSPSASPQHFHTDLGAQQGYDQATPPPLPHAVQHAVPSQPLQYQPAAIASVAGQIHYQPAQPQQHLESYQHGPPITIAHNDIQQHAEGTTTIAQHLLPPLPEAPSSQASPLNQTYQHLYAASMPPPSSQTPPVSQPPWVTEPPPPIQTIVESATPGYAPADPENRGSLAEEHHRILTEPPPPPPNFQTLPPHMPAAPQQILVPPPPPPPPQPVMSLSGQPQYANQLPQFAAPPPNYQGPPPPPLGMPYW